MRPDFPPEDSKLTSKRFELLSCYIDNQVTPAERKQVQEWLDTDPDYKKTYLRLLQLESSFKRLPVVSSGSAEAICTKVFAKIDRQQKRGQKIRLACSIAFVAILGFIWRGNSHYSLESVIEAKGDGELLTIALNRPILEMPQSPLK